jgi:protoporphyrinogen oxidase
MPAVMANNHGIRNRELGMRVGIVGGGIMGISLGYFLALKGVQVDVFEASGNIGGLAGSVVLEDGTAIDRFYHAIMSSDSHLIALCAELGVMDQLRFRETRMGFYYHGSVISMSNMVELLRFPPLGWTDRLRLGLTVLYAQLVRDWHRLEGISLEDWLVRLSGRRTYQEIWRPMLKAKFDGVFDQTPATFIWARLVRTRSARAGLGQKEKAGHLVGGYATLLKSMAEQIAARGGRIWLNRPVREIMIAAGQARGLRFENETRPYDAVVSTLQVPVFRRLLPGAHAGYLAQLDKAAYFGIVAAVLVMDRPLTGFWTLNIADDRIPFTGVIETTTYIDPKDVGGHHLVYLPKYTAPGSELQQLTDEEIRALWLTHLQAMFPDFDRESIQYLLVYRERYVEQVHKLNSMQEIPAIRTPIENLYLATTAQIYPGLSSGETVTRHARLAADLMLNDRGRNAG